jgi:hypothetical protein
MIQLVAGRKNEGYISALMRSFQNTDSTPVKSSFCKFRRKISYKFFASALTQLLSSFKRSTFRGMHIYAVDGKKAYVPRSLSLEKAGFQGKILSDYRESYHLVMYLTHAYDVLSGTTKELMASPINGEQKDARKMVPQFEKNSITLYDRLFLCHKLLKAHQDVGNFFIMRCKKASTLGEVVSFAASKEMKASFDYEGMKLNLIKIKTKKGVNIFITNLDTKRFSSKDIAILYRWRWDVETSFKEFTESLSLEQWHSGDYNNILQELYARLWLFNATKILCFNRGDIRHNPTSNVYQKTNFKLCVEWIVRKFNEVITGQRGIFKELKNLMRISTEKRKRYSRSYKREIKSPGSPYKYNNTIMKVNGIRI